MTILSTLKTFIQFVLVFVILSFDYLCADDSRSATVSKESPTATVQAFSHAHIKTVFKRFLSVSTSDDSVFKTVDAVSGDPSTIWMLVVDCDTQSLPYTFDENKPSTINYDGTNDPNADCKMYQPTFTGTAIPTGEGEGEPQEYSWTINTDGEHAAYNLDLKLDSKSEEKEEESPGVLIGCNAGRKVLTIEAKPKELGGKIKLTLSAGLKLYENATGGNPITPPADGWTPEQLDKTYYVGGVSGSVNMGDQNCTATWEGDGFTTITDKAVATVIEVDVKIDGKDYTEEPGALIRKKNDETAPDLPRVPASVTIKPAGLDQGTVTLTVPTILQAWKSQTGNENPQLVWDLTKAEDRNVDKKVYCSGITANKGELNVTHSNSNAVDKAKAAVYELDLVVDNLKENAEENPGTFLGLKTRKSLTVKANPTSLGGSVKLTTNGLKLYNGTTEVTQREWNVGSVPNLQIGGTASTNMRDKTCTLEWTGVTGLTENDIIKATVVTGSIVPGNALGSNSGLFPITDKKTEGVFVHWNIDDDDKSVSNPTNNAKHPGEDCSQNSVNAEDELKSLSISIQPANLNVSTVKLTIGDEAKLWKTSNKGLSNLLVGNKSRSWNLSDVAQKNEFSSLSQGIFVEGVASGSSDFSLEYTLQDGSNIELDKVKYNFIAANCGRQPNYLRNDVFIHYDPPSYSSSNTTLDYVYEKDITNMFPNLKNCEWSILHLPDGKFNCVAHSVGWNDRWVIDTGPTTFINTIDNDGGSGGAISIDFSYGNNDGKRDDTEIHKFFKDVANVTNYVATDESQAKIIYYSGFHAAKRHTCQCGNPKWYMFESKCGNVWIIEHRANQVCGNTPNSYGTIKFYYK